MLAAIWITAEKKRRSHDRQRDEIEQPVPVPRRVIGTQPVKSGALLASGGSDGEDYQPGTELDERKAKRTERIVALWFLIAFAASVGFMAYFIGWSGRDGGMHGLERARESNFWLGGLMTLSFLGMGVGVTIWVRKLMTSAPIEQARYDLSTDGRPAPRWPRTSSRARWTAA